MGSDRVLFLRRKEVCFETGFSLAVFSKTAKAEFTERGAERGPCSVVRHVLKLFLKKQQHATDSQRGTYRLIPLHYEFLTLGIL